jgi:hypothetical protein
MMKIILAAMLYFQMVAAFGAPLAAGSYAFKSAAGLNTEFSLIVIVGLPAVQHGNGWMWGAEGTNNGTAIQNVVAKLGNESVFVPLSAYSDLANPSKIDLIRQGKVHVVVIRGGDASTAYTTRIRFKAGVVLDRSVASGEFSREVHEETKYHFNVLKN